MASMRRSSSSGGGQLAFLGPPLFCLSFLFMSLYLFSYHHSAYLHNLLELETITHLPIKAAASTSATSSSPHPNYDPRMNPLAIPPGEAQNLPSIRVQESHVDKSRTQTTKYGGQGDKQHLGGFTKFDPDGVSPAVWRNMMEIYGVHSLVDVGCGRGTSTTWFLNQGVDILCVEGSHDAVEKTLLPDPATQVIEHDYSRGPYWPEKTYDAVWCVEFLEHVSRQFHYNYLTTFRKAALIFATSSRWGGWHHVEVHPDDWWILKFESYGLKYSKELTQQVRNWAGKEAEKELEGPHGEPYRAQHVFMSVKVFVNPMVAALPQHAHLFPRDGCFQDFKRDIITGRPCDPKKMETVLPKNFAPLKFRADKEEEWKEMLRKELRLNKNTTLS